MADDIKSLVNKLRKKDLQKKYKSLSAMANRNIRKIESRYGISWSVKKLQSELSIPKLDLWTKNNRVSSKPPKSKTKLEISIQILENFKKSKTHTVRGIKNVIKQQKNKIKERFKNLKKPINITDKQAEYLYLMFDNKDANFFIDKLGASIFQNEMATLMNRELDYDYMLERFKKFFEGEFDDDAIDHLKGLYDILVMYKDDIQPQEALEVLKSWGVEY